MDYRAWLGLAILVAYLGSGYLRIRASRRSGATHSFGHPMLDNLLLLISGLLLASALGLALWIFKADSHSVKGHGFAYILFLSLGGILTWLCNGILRRVRKPR
jgi:hypothetical protein